MWLLSTWYYCVFINFQLAIYYFPLDVPFIHTDHVILKVKKKVLLIIGLPDRISVLCILGHSEEFASKYLYII